MLKVVIVEDEEAAAVSLQQMLHEVLPDVHILAVLSSVANAVEWFHIHPHPDLILMDIRLSDGDSLHIFQRCKINVPVIFITGHDDFIEEAFQHNGIDYVFKPVERAKLVHALKKYQGLRLHFRNKYNELLEYMISPPRYPNRIIVKKGRDFQAARTEEVACFFSRMKMVLIKTGSGRELVTDQSNLVELAEKLDPKKFFKANRNYIVNIDYISGYTIFNFSKLKIELTVPVDGDIIVSQVTSPKFRTWIEGYN